MKTTTILEPEAGADDDLCSEYSFDYSQARTDRFAGQVDSGQVVVLLDPDISEVFKTPESVNAILRALITAMPPAQTRPGRKSPTDSKGGPTVR